MNEEVTTELEWHHLTITILVSATSKKQRAGPTLLSLQRHTSTAQAFLPQIDPESDLTSSCPQFIPGTAPQECSQQNLKWGSSTGHTIQFLQKHTRIHNTERGKKARGEGKKRFKTDLKEAYYPNAICAPYLYSINSSKSTIKLI